MRKLIVGLLAGLMLLGVVTGCDTGTTNDKLQEQRKQSIKDRSTTFQRAQNIAPIPRTVNFPLRKALVKHTARQDEINHPWYVYILGQNGNTVGYYVGQTAPINACDFLSSTEVVDSSDNGKVVLTAPSLDGIYYGGAGAANGCDTYFFFDYTTDAEIYIRGVNFYVVDQPLKIDATAIKVTNK